MGAELAPNQLYVTVDLMILTVREGRLNLLLSRRGKPPFAGRWALPGTFIGLRESAEEAAERLLKEMLPVKEPFFEQLYTFADVGRDPRGRVISTTYLVIVPWGALEKVMAANHLSFRCFRLAAGERGLLLTDETGLSLPPGDLAFDHGRIIDTGLKRLRGKITYTDIGFRFLEDTDAFSLGELQSVFEAVLGEPLDGSNFRRGILTRYEKTNRLEQTKRTEKSGRGRPAALYRMELE